MIASVWSSLILVFKIAAFIMWIIIFLVVSMVLYFLWEEFNG